MQHQDDTYQGGLELLDREGVQGGGHTASSFLLETYKVDQGSEKGSTVLAISFEQKHFGEKNLKFKC